MLLVIGNIYVIVFEALIKPSAVALSHPGRFLNVFMVSVE